MVRRLKLAIPFGLLAAMVACSTPAGPSAQENTKSGAPAPASPSAEANTKSFAPAPASAATESRGTGSNGADLNACLNTTAEVSAAFDVKVTEAESVTAVGGATCTYYTNKAAKEEAMRISLSVDEMGRFMIDTLAADQTAVAVSGIGDQAWFTTDASLVIAKGGRTASLSASISIAAPGDPAVRPKLEELGRLAAGRL